MVVRACVSSSACASSKRCSAYLWSAWCSACLSASSTAPALSGSWAGRGMAGDGGKEATDRCSAEPELEPRRGSELEPEAPQLSPQLLTQDHLLAASGSAAALPAMLPIMLPGIELLGLGSAAADLGPACRREARSSLRRETLGACGAAGQGRARCCRREARGCWQHRLSARSRRRT